MMKILCSTLAMVSIIFASHGQNVPQADSLEHEKFLVLVNANREQTYMTFGSGIGNLEPLIVESNISPSYFFSRRHKRWALLINPQVQVRILNRKSVPVRNPSYRVYGTFFRELEFWERSFFRKVFYKNALWSFSYAHHSNGQDGKFYLDEATKEVNIDDADFSTDFFEGGISSYSVESLGGGFYSMRELKVTFEYHSKAWANEELKDLYGFYRFFVTLGILGPRKNHIAKKNVAQWLQQSSLEMKTGWIFGKMENAGFSEASRRLIVDITYKYYPKWFDEIAFFVRFYRGQDYYNIQFVNDPLYNLSFGITSNIMNYREVVKLFDGKEN